MYCVYFYPKVQCRTKNTVSVAETAEYCEMEIKKIGECKMNKAINGFQFKGYVKGFDNYVAIFDCDGKQQLVYKHAISTIIPSKSVSILDTADKAE